MLNLRSATVLRQLAAGIIQPSNIAKGAPWVIPIEVDLQGTVIPA
ncbi:MULTISPECIES: hypothetical protein [unclassified Mesorhizobium]|nr:MULTISPECIES: hypothetical protein [unclassified Mesorhizobium]ESZ02180.1 hypothetical protein X736_31055 [Mesorhizobium sp. L2C089B000]